MLRAALAALLATTALGALAQGKFVTHGRLKIENGDLGGARAVVYKNGVKERTITANLSKFTLELDLGASYIVSFEKDGYVSKKLSFDTRVPADAVAKGFTPFEFAVSLFKQYDDLNMVVFNQPVGMIRYDAEAGDFDYDTDYTKSIQSQLQSAVTEVEKKQKLEAEQAKAQAKADAERKKQEAAQAAAEAKAQAEAAKAQAEAERKAAAEAEKRKAEEARAAAEAARAQKAREEAARKEAAKPPPVAKAEPKAEPKPEPAPQPKAEPKPAPKPIPPAPAPQRSTLAAKPATGADSRRAAAPVVAEEPSRMAKAQPVVQHEERPVAEAPEPIVSRTEDLVVEAGKITTVVRVEIDGRATEYRRVYHKWGGVFYFKDGQPCSQLVYEQEAFPPDQLAGASPRGKLD